MESQDLLTTDDLKEVLRELADVTHKWYYIGLELGLKSGDLDPIQQQSSDSLAKACEMANRWLKNALQPTWLALADALSSPTVNEAQKAKELRQKKHCQTPIASEEKLKGDSVLFTPASTQDQQVTESISTPLDTSLDSLKLDDALSRQDSGGSDSIVKSKPQPAKEYPKSSFPYLDVSQLTTKEAEHLKGRLLYESQIMMYSFQDLASETMDSLFERGITPQDLVSRLMSLRALKPVYDKQPPIPALLHRSEDLKNATTLQDVFIIVQDYCSFFNYEIIGYIIKHLGTEKDKLKLQEYKEELKRYSRRRVFECPLEYGSRADPSQVYVVVKLDKDFECFTVEALQIFKGKLSTIFGLEHPLELLYVDEGCMQMTYQIPHTVECRIFPLSPEQRRELKEEGVIRLSCNNYSFEAPRTPAKQSQVCLYHKFAHSGCRHGERCSFKHEESVPHSQQCKGVVQIPDYVPFGMLVGKGRSNLKKMMGSTGCLLTPHSDSRKVEISAADEDTLAIAKEKLQAMFTQLYSFGPTWCFFHTDGVKERSLLEFRQSVHHSHGPPKYEIYTSEPSFSRAVDIEQLEKFSPASPLDSEDTFHSTLDTLHGTGVERQTSVDEAVQTVRNQTRFMMNYREWIQKELQSALGWFQKNQGQQRAKLEARFGKVIWTLPPNILSEQPLEVEKFVEFVFSDTRGSQAFVPGTRRVERLQKELEAMCEATQDEDTFVLKLSVEGDAKKIEVRFKFERGKPEILDIRKGEGRIVVFDILCLHRQHDIRLCLSKFEVVPPTHPVFAIVQKLLQTVLLKEPETMTFVPFSDEWNVFYIRHRRTTTYIHDGKYIIEIKHTTEKSMYVRNTDKGKEIPVKLRNHRTEVEVRTEIWEHAFKSASQWNPQAIVYSLDEFFRLLDNFNTYLEES